jgi:hypothetical protein
MVEISEKIRKEVGIGVDAEPGDDGLVDVTDLADAEPIEIDR